VKIILLLISIFCFSATSCQVAENVVVSQEKQKEFVTKNYEKDGLSCSYQCNWKIKYDEVYQELGRVVAVEDSNNGIFVISLFPLEVPLDLEEYAEETKREWKSRIKNGKDFDIKTSEITRNILLEPSSGIRLKFSFENIPYTQDLFLVKGKKRIAVVALQTIDKNLENADKDFQAIFDSLEFE